HLARRRGVEVTQVDRTDRGQLMDDHPRRTSHRHSHHQRLGRGIVYTHYDGMAAPDVTPASTPSTGSGYSSPGCWPAAKARTSSSRGISRSIAAGCPSRGGANPPTGPAPTATRQASPPAPSQPQARTPAGAPLPPPASAPAARDPARSSSAASLPTRNPHGFPYGSTGRGRG